MYSPSLEDLRTEVDADITSFLDEHAAVVPEARPLLEEIRRVVGLGGKRLRPAFCYWGYRVGSGEPTSGIVRVGTALELLHTFALVHDDIMDDADLRRGRPSTQAAHDPDFALLAGDLALVLADIAFESAGFPSDAQSAASATYTRMKLEVIAGQFLDYDVARTRDVTEEIARRIALLKSGLYSVVEPLTIGAQLGGATDDAIAVLRRFGAPLGEAFQLRDDLLGLFGEPTTVGKPVGSDVREGKLNLLYVRTVACLEADERARFITRWGAGDLTAEEVGLLTEVVERCGARREVEELLGGLVREARAALQDLDTGREILAALDDLVAAATTRPA